MVKLRYIKTYHLDEYLVLTHFLAKTCLLFTYNMYEYALISKFIYSISFSTTSHFSIMCNLFLVHYYVCIFIYSWLYRSACMCFIQAYTSKTSLSIVSIPPYSPLYTLHFTAISLFPPYFFTPLHTTLGEKGPRKLQILFELKGKWQIVYAFLDAFLCNDFTIISFIKKLFNMLYKNGKMYK